MSKLILKGVLQTFDRYKPNGRIYPESILINEIKRIRSQMRINKIKRLFNSDII
jgi:hypothetical protein